jgi:flagellar biosynthetic protein FlhB
MAEDLGDKTEAPTPRRRAEAREEGNIARSADLTAATLLLGAMILLSQYGGGLVKALRVLVGEMLSPRSLGNFDVHGVGGRLVWAAALVARAIAPVLVGIVVIAVLVNLLQVGLFFSPKRLQPNFGALNPTRGLGKLLSGGGGVMSLVMNVAKLLLVAAVAYSAVHGRMAQIVGVQHLTFLQIFGLGGSIVYSIALRIGLLLLVLALIDYGWQRYRIEQDLKMTKQEVKEEMKRMEGDPKIKQRRRQVAQQVAMQRMKKAVPTADVVVTNPTEFAVALKYDQATMHAPRVVAKGQGYIAAKIRELAIAAGVPIVERKPLARALYALCEVGQEIPEEWYSTVAEILAYVYELSGKAKRMQTV